MNPGPTATLAGIVWPIITGRGHRGQLLSLLRQFEQTERLPPGQLLRQQLLQLSAVVDHARRTVPFYRDRFGGLPPGPAVLQTLPLLTRRDIQDAGQRLRSTAIPPQFGGTHENRTSGATGEPVSVLRTMLDGLLWQANTLRDHAWHGRDPLLKLAAIRAVAPGTADPPHGVDAANWGQASAALGRTGPAALLTLDADVAVQADWLRRQAPGYLLTYPNNLAALIDHFARCGERLPSLRAMLTVGETVSPALRTSCREVLGVEIQDVYSSQELGYIALQCPASGLYHVMAESVLVEVLDAAGKPCAPGETGRLVVSSLHNYATPLIRYELRDHATVGGPCTCGRTLPTLARIAGRERNMVKLPGGRTHWPLVGFQRFRDIAPLRQYQLIQRSLEEIEVRLVCDRALSTDEETRLATVIRDALGHPFVLRFMFFDGELPRSANGKFEEFVCAISQG
jgi:phenylacetate-CoA ligase